MIIRTLTLFDRFKCSGAACKDTCCVRDRLVIDNKTYFEYQRVIAKGDAFGRRMVASISERNGVATFRLRENGECPFLLRSHLCELHIRLGADKVCETCRKYPAFEKEYGNRREIGFSFSCPEVLRLVLTHPEHFATRQRENDTDPIIYDNLDAEMLQAIYPVRERFLEIAQDARNSLQMTLSILLRLALRVQDAIDRREYGEFASIIAPFENDPTGGMSRETPDPILHDALMQKLLKLHNKLEYRKQENAVRIVRAYRIFKSETPTERAERERAFLALVHDRIYEYRKWLFYVLHRDLLDTVRDRQFCAHVCHAVVTTLCLFEYGSLEWKSRGKFPTDRQEELFRNYSKEIEDNPRNYARLQKKLTGSNFATEKLVHVVSHPAEEGGPAVPFGEDL